MPNIGHVHPQLVHFVIALLGVGVVARTLSLLPLPARFAFVSPAAATLILLGTLASVVAAKAGKDAEDPSERLPGVRPAVQDHEEWGERTRSLFLIVSALEVGALALGTRKAAPRLRAGSALLGLAGLVVLYEAGERGGDLVYSYAGGVGTRSGDTTDVRRLLVAGLFNAALSDRQAGRPEQAARLVGELGRRMPEDTTVRLMMIESLLRDTKDPKGTLAALDAFSVSPDNRRLVIRLGTLRADALAAAGQNDSARTVIQGLLKRFSDNPRLKQQLERQGD